MKHYIALFALHLVFACNTSSKKKAPDNAGSELKTNTVEQPVMEERDSGDYSSLYVNYECTSTVSEIAEILDVPENDLTRSDYQQEGKCSFDVKGFGINTLGNSSAISWGPFPTTKAQNKKEIASYLKRKKEGLKIMGMDIELADTGDCYLAYQPGHGRLIIYNENYDHAFFISYGRRSANNDRTEEQHEALKPKMTDLANYLLKKHRK